MNNKNELKREYLDLKEHEYEIDKALDENLKEFLKIKKNEDFVYIEHADNEMLKDIISNLSKDELPDMEKLEIEYDNYRLYLNEMLRGRLKLYNERMMYDLEFNEWLYKHNMTNWSIEEEWFNEAKTYEKNWCGWSSNDLVYEAMYYTIWMTDEEGINRLIKNARKVCEMIEYDTHVQGYIDDLEFINTRLRHCDIEDGVEHVFILDCLENDCMWEIYKEPFMCFVQKVIWSVDSEYISYLEEMKYVDNK